MDRGSRLGNLGLHAARSIDDYPQRNRYVHVLAEELDRALLLETSLIGINNRNLKTLHTDLAVTEELAPLVPPDRFLISESGIRNTDDLRRLAAVGPNCYLVGERLMRRTDVAAAVRELLGDGM